MFNVEKALKKLDEYISTSNNAIGDGAYFHIRLKDLSEILLAGQEDEVYERDWKEHLGVLRQAVEDRRRIANIEERLARLEKRMNNADPVGGLFGGTEKPVVGKKPQHMQCTICGHDYIGFEDCPRCRVFREEKPVIEEKPDIVDKKSGGIDMDKLCREIKKAELIQGSNHVNGIGEKPSEFIRIPRSVAECWLEYIESQRKFSDSELNLRGSIKQQLG